MEFKDGKIYLNRMLSKLDKFALSFLKILEKYAEYVVMSGYVSIVLGRTRATEDIDVFIKPITKETFFRLYKELQDNGFWCLNAEDEEEIFSYLNNKLAIRFARKNTYAPNFEIKYPKDELEKMTFDDSIEVVFQQGKIRISGLERNIAFKRYYLGSRKDVEDAKHIEELFKEHINKEKINNYQRLIEDRKRRQYGK